MDTKPFSSLSPARAGGGQEGRGQTGRRCWLTDFFQEKKPERPGLHPPRARPCLPSSPSAPSRPSGPLPGHPLCPGLPRARSNADMVQSKYQKSELPPEREHSTGAHAASAAAPSAAAHGRLSPQLSGQRGPGQAPHRALRGRSAAQLKPTAVLACFTRASVWLLRAKINRFKESKTPFQKPCGPMSLMF